MLSLTTTTTINALKAIDSTYSINDLAKTTNLTNSMHIASDVNDIVESSSIECHANTITTTAVIYTLPTPAKPSLAPNSSLVNAHLTTAPLPDTSTTKAQNETFV